jgi:hypothetical protein
VLGNGLDNYPGGPPDQNLYTLADSDGIMAEHFAVFESVLANGSLSVPLVAQFIADVGIAAAAGKTVVVALWPGLCTTPFTPQGYPSWPGNTQPSTNDGWRAALLDKHRFALAAFLIVAEANVWMQYEGWYDGLTQGAIQCPEAPESCAAPLQWFVYFAPRAALAAPLTSPRLLPISFPASVRYPQLFLPLGAPLGPAVRTGSAWSRSFAHASVLLDLVDTNASGVTFTS